MAPHGVVLALLLFLAARSSDMGEVFEEGVKAYEAEGLGGCGERREATERKNEERGER